MTILPVLPIFARSRYLLCCLTAIVIGCDQAAGSPQTQFEQYVQSQSMIELGTTLESGTVWPKLDHESADDRRVARAFLAKCGAEHVLLNQTHQRHEIAVYLKLITPMRKAGGYLNGVLQDTLYRMALSDIAGMIVQHPEQATEMETHLARLQPGPWYTIGIGHIIADHLGDPAQGANFSQWPEKELLGRVSRLFGVGLPTERVLFTPSTSKLIEQPSPHDLIHRTSETQWMLTYAIPGLLSYLKHDGDLRDLDGQDVGPFLALMGNDRRQFQFPMYGTTMLRATDLIAVRDAFATPNKQPRFLENTLN